MVFYIKRPLYQCMIPVLLFALGFWITHDLLNPCLISAQTTAEEFFEKGKAHWDQMELDEVIASLNKAIDLGLISQADQIEAHRILAYCWVAKQESLKAQNHFVQILQIDSEFQIPLSESPAILRAFQKAQFEFDTMQVTREPEKKKSSLWLFAGGGAAVLGVAALVLFGGEEEDKSTDETSSAILRDPPVLP